MNLHRRVYAHLLLLLSLLISGVAFPTQVSAQIAQRETLYVDDSDGAPYYAETGSTWVTYTSFGWDGAHRYLTLDDPSNINQTARWTPDMATAGYYAVSFYVPRTSNSRNHVLYVVSALGTAPDSSWHDQNYNSGYFINLGVHYLPDETGSFVEVVNDSTSTSGYSFRADAIRYILGPDEKDIEPGRRNGYDYGEVALLDLKDWALRIYNIGGTALTVYDITFGNSDVYFLYELSPPVDIEPRGCEDFTIRFHPTAERIIEDTLRIISNDDDEPSISIPLRGTGVAPFVLVNDDDGAPGYVEEAGEWKQSAGVANCPGIANSGSRYVVQGGNLGARATFTPHIPLAGYYRIESALPATHAASSNALYVIYPGGVASDSVWINQNTDSACEWRLLGIHYLLPGWENCVSVINDGTGTGYVLRTDLMKFTLCSAVPVELETSEGALPETYDLFPNYPNPFNVNTEIHYQIPTDGPVTVKIFNTLGQEVRSLVDENQKANTYVIDWDGRDNMGREVASSIFFCRLEAGDFSKTIKMVLIK